MILALIVITTVALLTLDVRGSGPIGVLRDGAHDVVSPIAGVLDRVFSPVGDWFDGVTRAASLKDENARLRRQLQQERGNAEKSKIALQENKELKRLLDIPFIEDINAYAARVVAGPPGNFEWTIQIDRGSGGHVANDMAVVTGDGLVGRVVNVSSDRATVLLVKDPESGVGVKIEGSGAQGILKGRGDNDRLRLDFVDPNAQVKKGQLVWTAGEQGSPYPPDIPVGTVAKVDKSPGDLQQSVLVKPLVDFGALNFVKVVPRQPGG